MKKYELMLIFSTNQATEALDKVRAMLVEANYSNIKEEDWKVRDLAYIINKESKGHYYLFKFEADGSKNRELEVKLNMYEPILRHLLIKDESEEIKEKIAKKSAERSKRKAEREANKPKEQELDIEAQEGKHEQ